MVRTSPPEGVIARGAPALRRARAAPRRAPTGGRALVGGCVWNRKRENGGLRAGAMSIARRGWRGEAMTIAGASMRAMSIARRGWRV